MTNCGSSCATLNFAASALSAARRWLPVMCSWPGTEALSAEDPAACATASAACATVAPAQLQEEDAAACPTTVAPPQLPAEGSAACATVAAEVCSNWLSGGGPGALPKNAVRGAGSLGGGGASGLKVAAARAPCNPHSVYNWSSRISSSFCQGCCHMIAAACATVMLSSRTKNEVKDATLRWCALMQ